MTDPPQILNLDEPYPNVVIDQLRRAVKTQIDDLAREVQRINDALLLLQATADFAQSTLNTVKAARTQLGVLAGRLTALEEAHAPEPPEPEPEPEPGPGPADDAAPTEPEEQP